MSDVSGQKKRSRLKTTIHVVENGAVVPVFSIFVDVLRPPNTGFDEFMAATNGGVLETVNATMDTVMEGLTDRQNMDFIALGESLLGTLKDKYGPSPGGFDLAQVEVKLYEGDGAPAIRH